MSSDPKSAGDAPAFTHTRKVSRLPALPEQLHPIIAQRFAEQRARGADPINLHLVQAHAPELAKARAEFTWALRNGTKVGRKMLELVIVRVASIMQCAYELHHHLPMIAQAGYTAEQIAAVGGDWRNARSLFTDAEAALLAFVDEMCDAGKVSDATYEALAAHFSPQEIVEICYATTSYYANAMFVRAIRLEVDPPHRHTAMGKF